MNDFTTIWITAIRPIAEPGARTKGPAPAPSPSHAPPAPQPRVDRAPSSRSAPSCISSRSPPSASRSRRAASTTTRSPRASLSSPARGRRAIRRRACVKCEQTTHPPFTHTNAHPIRTVTCISCIRVRTRRQGGGERYASACLLSATARSMIFAAGL